MFANLVTITTTAATRTFDLVSREGMSTLRNESTAGVGANEMHSLVIKHDADRKKLTKPNRRLVQLNKVEVVDSVEKIGSVHLVVTQPKGFPDADIIEMAAQIVAWATPANVEKLLKGGN